MKTNTIKFTLLMLLASISSVLFAQSVGINSGGNSPNAAAVLDLNTGNTGTQGFLPEQVALTATNAASPITSPPTGLIVYNTATAGTSPNNVTPGYYFNAGTAVTPNWVQFTAGNSATTGTGSWLLNGNTGTVVGTNFLGTNDAQALEFKVDAQKAGWIDYASPYNTSLGWKANNATNGGTNNTAVGLLALASNAKQNGNIAMSDSALYSQSYGTGFTSGNVAIGNSTLYANQPSSASNGYDNTAIGQWSMRYNTTGYNNNSIGYGALYANTTGNNNIAIGTSALFSNVKQTGNIAIGDSALYSQNLISGSGSFHSANIALGNSALYATQATNPSNGNYNTAIGEWAMRHNSIGDYNTGIGSNSLYANTTGSYNTGIGQSALFSNTSGGDNTANGYNALYYNTTGGDNTANGAYALYENSTGADNTSIGQNSLTTNSTGGNNTSGGFQSLYSNTTASNNTAFGSNSLYSNTTGTNNTAVGYDALYKNTTGISNKADGAYALYNTTTGSFNTGEGDSALYTNTTGSGNTGYGYNADVAANNLTNATAIGYKAKVGASNMIQFGNSSVVALESSGNVIYYNPTTVGMSSGGSIATSTIISGYINGSPTSAVNITLPTASSLANAVAGSGPSVTKGTTICFTVEDDNNTAGNTMTVSVNTGITVITGGAITGETNMTVSNSSIGVFKIIFTTGSTAVIMRVN